MKLTTLVAMMAFCVLTLFGGSPVGKGAAQMEKLKGLVGSWDGTGKDGNPIHVSYKMVSAGSTLMETLDMAEHKESMMTVYHMNGDKVMLTHYCSMGNQPRMKAESSKDENTLAFSFVDATNMAGPRDAHMHKVVFTFKDDDHFTQEWTMREKGKDGPPTVFNFERAK